MCFALLWKTFYSLFIICYTKNWIIKDFFFSLSTLRKRTSSLKVVNNKDYFFFRQNRLLYSFSQQMMSCVVSSLASGNKSLRSLVSQCVWNFIFKAHRFDEDNDRIQKPSVMKATINYSMREILYLFVCRSIHWRSLLSCSLYALFIVGNRSRILIAIFKQ